MTIDKEKIKEVVADALGMDVADIDDSDNFVKDLAMNSLVMLDCIADIEDLYDVRIPNSDIRNLTCVDEIVKYFENMPE